MTIDAAFFKCIAARLAAGRPGGNITIYIVTVMMLFAALATALVSIYATANLVSVAGDDSRQAAYMAESGVRYAMTQLRTTDTRTTIQTLNTTTYTLSEGDAFTVNVFPKWFQAASDVSVTTGQTLDLDVPDNATVPDGFVIPAGAYIVNIDSLRDAIAFGGDKTRFYTSLGTDSTAVDGDTLRVEVADAFQASAGQPVMMAVRPNLAQYGSDGVEGTGETAIAVDGSADLVVGVDAPAIAESIFHEDGGTFYVLNPNTGVRRMYAYDSYSTASPVTLNNIRGVDALSIDYDRDLIIFSDRNHAVYAQGKTGPGTSEATAAAGIELPRDTSTAPVWSPEAAEETPTDVGMAAMVQTAVTPYSNAGAIQIGSDALGSFISMGMDIGSAYSAAWYGGTQNVGGMSANFCSAGKCRFEYGMRAYFTVDYDGSADGFTFALMNGADNTTSSTGGPGGYMGYAGSSGGSTGIDPPKLALEFDTYTNTGFNDPGSSNKDYMNLVFWGADDASTNDDNTHDTWASTTTVSSNIRGAPYVEADGNVLVASTDGNVYRFNSRGEQQATVSLGASTDSSPVVDSYDYIWIGSNNSRINRIPSDFSGRTSYSMGADVRTIPAVSGDRVFFGTDYTGTSSSYCNFCVIVYWHGSLYWDGGWYPFFHSTDVIRGSPFIDAGDVYFGGNRSGGNVWSYTVGGSDNWSGAFTTGSDVYARPVVSSSGKVFFGTWENDRYFYCVSTAKVQQWVFDTGYVSVYAGAAVDESRNRVYFGTAEIRSGSYDGKVYALDTNTGSEVWSYQTGGAIYSSPVVGPDGAVMIGSDDGYLYAFEPDGSLRWKLDLKDDVRSSPALNGAQTIAYVGSDEDYLYGVPVSGNPWQFKTWEDEVAGTHPYMTYGVSGANNLPTDAYTDGTISSGNNWLNSGPWAVRVEVERSQTAGSNGRYPYTVRSWIRQCDADPGDCSEITGTFFSDTRIAYAAKTAQMTQTFELSAADHAKFETYYNGFTQGTGGATQTLTLRNIRIGFIRPGDYVISPDGSGNWR